MRRLVATPLLALVVLLALAAAAPVVASAQEPLFGAWNPGDPYMGHTNGANALEAATGRRVEIVHWYQGWGGGAFGAPVQPQSLEAVARSGRTPLVTWEPWTPTAGLAQPDFQLARIAAGAYDAYISEWAVALRLVGSPVYLRPMHEFNGDWYPWSGAVNGNTPEQFVQAWRRIVDIFRGLGAANVRFVWSPNNIDVPASTRWSATTPATRTSTCSRSTVTTGAPARPSSAAGRRSRRSSCAPTSG